MFQYWVFDCAPVHKQIKALKAGTFMGAGRMFSRGVHKNYFCFRGVHTFLFLEAHLIFQLHEGHDLHKSTMSCASKAKKAILFANVHGFMLNLRAYITSAGGASANLVRFACKRHTTS